MSETCSTCRHWFNAKACRRYPEAIEKRADDTCGEWSAKVIKAGDVVTSSEVPALGDAAGVALGTAEAVERIQSVKKGGRR